MKKVTWCLLRFASIVGLVFSISSCSSGGESSGGGSAPVATPTQTIVSGTVQAPGGTIAFFKQPSLGDFFESNAYAALTGLANVPDNTIVQLARLNANASNFSVITTTTTSGGRYSFNLTTLGLQPANDLIVHVAGSGGKEMRAFVVGTVVDLSPVSEAAYQLAIQSLNGGPLSNLTLQEVSDISGSVGLIATLQNIGNATSVDQAVGLVKTTVGANGQVTGFIAAAAANGQTSQGTGDIGNYFPFEQGNIWRYQGTRSGSGSPTTGYDTNVLVSGQEPAPINGINSTVFSETNDEGENRAEKSFSVKGASGITSYGNDDPNDTISRQLVPFQSVHFPLTLGATNVLVERTGLDWGDDEDGDGRNEIFNVKILQTVLSVESITVRAGTFANSLRIEQKAVFVVNFTRGGAGIVTQTNTAWHVPGVGRVKEVAQVEIDGGPVVASLTEELFGYVVNGQGSGLRIELMRLSPPVATTVDGTKQLEAFAYDQNNGPVVGLPFFWNSGNPAVATIDQNGLLTGISAGTTTVTASIGGLTSNSLPVTVMDLRLLAMYTRDIAYDQVNNRIYASIAGNSGNLSNTLARINPDTGVVDYSIGVGVDPGKLAISDDGQYLYVAIDAGKTIVKFHIPTRTVQGSFPLGNYFVQDMVVLVGNSQSLAVARSGLSPGSVSGVAIYDNGVPRPVTTNQIVSFMERTESPGILYGFLTDSLYTISVDASGARITNVVMPGLDIRDMVYDSGRLYIPGGEVYSPVTSSLIGSYPVPALASSLNRVLPYSSLNRVFFAPWFNPYLWLAFDQTTFAPAGSVNIFDLTTGSPLRFIRWGSNGLALTTDAGQVFILRSTLFK